MKKGAGTVVQLVKLLFMMPVPIRLLVQVPSASRKLAEDIPKAWVLATDMGPGHEFQGPALVCPAPAYYGYLENEPVDAR